MPALSQNLTFTVNSSTVTSLVYPTTATSAVSYTSQPIKGDGYYGSSDGFHTIQVKLTNFVGKIEIQSTLEIEPAESDWFVTNLELNENIVDTTGASINKSATSISLTQPTNLVKIYNFEGNFVWIRAKVTNFTQGIIDKINFNH